MPTVLEVLDTKGNIISGEKMWQRESYGAGSGQEYVFESVPA